MLSTFLFLVLSTPLVWANHAETRVAKRQPRPTPPPAPLVFRLKEQEKEWSVSLPKDYAINSKIEFVQGGKRTELTIATVPEGKETKEHGQVYYFNAKDEKGNAYLIGLTPDRLLRIRSFSTGETLTLDFERPPAKDQLELIRFLLSNKRAPGNTFELFVKDHGNRFKDEKETLLRWIQADGGKFIRTYDQFLLFAKEANLKGYRLTPIPDKAAFQSAVENHSLGVEKRIENLKEELSKKGRDPKGIYANSASPADAANFFQSWDKAVPEAQREGRPDIVRIYSWALTEGRPRVEIQSYEKFQAFVKELNKKGYRVESFTPEQFQFIQQRATLFRLESSLVGL